MISTHEKVFLPKYWHHTLVIFFLALISFFLYSHTLSYPFMNWDDPKYVTETTTIRPLSASSLKEMFTGSYVSIYVPLTILSYTFDYQIFHLNPFGYHLTNLILHLLNISLVYSLIYFLTKEWMISIAIALLFAVHPVQTESVIWIAERKNVLSSLFFLLSLLSYASGRFQKTTSKIPWILCFLFFLAGCFSKPNVVVLPLLLIAFDLSYGYFKKEKWLRYLPFFLGAFLFALATVSITHGAGKMRCYAGSFSSTMLVMLVVMMRYLGLLLFPLRQSLLYEFPLYHSIAHPHVALSFLGIILLLLGLDYLWLKERKLFFWGAWYFILLLPVMNIIPFPSLMNDRYLYLPMIGFFTLLLLLLKRNVGPFLTTVLILVSIPVFTCLNLKRQSVWANPESLWTQTQAMTEGKKEAKYLASFVNLGDSYLLKNEPDKAIEEYSKALKISREDATTYGGIGRAYFQKGNFEKAFEYFQKGIVLATEKASFHNFMGLIYQEQRKWNPALEEFRRAISSEPKDPKYPNNLGILFNKMGKPEDASREFSKALTLDPDYPDALYNLGQFYLNGNNLDEAWKYWSKLMRVNPNYSESARAHDSFGVALAVQGRMEEAIPHFSEALRINPSSYVSHTNLGSALFSQGKVDEAILHYTKALELNANYDEAHYNLGVALATQGKAKEAIAQLSEALRINPQHQGARYALNDLKSSSGK